MEASGFQAEGRVLPCVFYAVYEMNRFIKKGIDRAYLGDDGRQAFMIFSSSCCEIWLTVIAIKLPRSPILLFVPYGRVIVFHGFGFHAVIEHGIEWYGRSGSFCP